VLFDDLFMAIHRIWGMSVYTTKQMLYLNACNSIFMQVLK